MIEFGRCFHGIIILNNNNNMFFLDSGLTFTASTKSFTNSNVNASNERITISSHAMSTEQAVQIEPLDTATMPGGINKHQTYFIKSIDANTVELYLTAAGATAGTNQLLLQTVLL